MAAGIIFAAISGEVGALNDAIFAAAEDAPMLIIELCGMICLWTGLMKIAEKSEKWAIFLRNGWKNQIECYFY